MKRYIRWLLGSLLLLVALNAFAGGYYAMMGASDIPREWLNGSPFKNYLIPGIFLFVCVGLSSLLAGILVLKRHRLAPTASFSSATIVLLWIVVQVAIIGYRSWMQPATTVAAIIIILITWKLQRQ